MNWLRSALSLMLLLAAAFPARADPAYVSERLSVGVHESDSLASTILVLVSSGTELEVLAQEGGLAKVQLEDGVVGWVDARYLTNEIPSSRKLVGLEAELTQTATELANAREQAAELEFQLNRARERASVMEAELLEARKMQNETEKAKSANAPAKNGDAVRKLRQASDENRRLKRQVAELEARLGDEGSQSGSKNSAIAGEPGDYATDDRSLFARYTAVTRWEAWQILLLLFSLLLAFAAGGYVVDWEVRRRHGGFRV